MNTNQNKAMNRVDGRLKVTGGARYAAEFPLQNMAHAVVIESTIARGQIKNIDTSTASQAPCVLAIITHLNAPSFVQTAGTTTSEDTVPESGGNPFTKPVAVLKDAKKFNFFHPSCLVNDIISSVVILTVAFASIISSSFSIGIVT